MKIGLNKLVWCVLFCSLNFVTFAKGKPSLKRADKYYKNTEYSKAAEEYKRLDYGRRTDTYIYLQLADCYDRLDRIVEASKYYGKAILKDPDVSADIYYRYAKVLQKSGRQEVARDMMDDFAELAPTDSRAKDFLHNPDAYYDLSKLPEKFMFQESGLNDRFYDDFGAVLTKNDTLYFVSNRTKQEKKFMRKIFEVRDKYKRRPNYDIYQAEFKSVQEPIFTATRLKGRINRRFNDGIVAPSLNDDKKMYFASESYRYPRYRNNKTVKHRDRIMNLFQATLKNKKWKKIKKLPFTTAGYTYQSPSVSPDGKYLYFASNMEGSYGELDIWRVELLEDDDYGEPENMGSVINSGTRNDYPFVSEDNILYFSSDRWGGYGGFDIYSIDLNDSKAKAVNIGAPINSARDDFAFTYYPDRKIGFFSSNRIGRTDIYKAIPICKVDIELRVKNKSFNKEVSDAIIEFTNSRRRIENKAVTDKGGIALGQLGCDDSYSIKVSHPDYLDEIVEISVKQGDSKQIIEVLLHPLEELMIEEDRITLEEIHFAFDQKEITLESKFELDKLVKVMKRYVSMRIKVASHTDSKGRAEYNLKLSQDRAKATVEYLISQGIEQERLEYQGYGSQDLKIKCEPCTEWEDAQNRRSEFIILSK